MTTAPRPTVDGLQADIDTEWARRIGPPAPWPLPKLMPDADRAALRASYDQRLAKEIAWYTATAVARDRS